MRNPRGFEAVVSSLAACNGRMRPEPLRGEKLAADPFLPGAAAAVRVPGFGGRARPSRPSGPAVHGRWARRRSRSFDLARLAD